MSNLNPDKKKIDDQFAGPALPFGFGVQGVLGNKPSTAVIATNIAGIIKTRKGTLPYAPSFGSTVLDMQFEPEDEMTRAQLRYYIRLDIERWEPRALVRSVLVSPHPTNPDAIKVNVAYSLRDDPGQVYGTAFDLGGGR